MATYHWLRIRSGDRTWAEGYERFQRDELPGVETWGAFYGLFGVASNELILVVHGDDDASAAAITAAAANADFEVVEAHELVPTVRPERFEPVTEPGLYVFRVFDVAHEHVDEIAMLSRQAWTSFENTDAYDTEPKGLFCQADRSSPSGVMVLVTWYDGLESWQASRRSAPDARENFRRRRALTKRTIAYATRLVGT